MIGGVRAIQPGSGSGTLSTQKKRIGYIINGTKLDNISTTCRYDAHFS